MDQLGEDMARLWATFRHDVNVATHSLLYLLDSVYALHVAERVRLARSIDLPGSKIKTLEDALRVAGDIDFPRNHPKLRGSPRIMGEPLYSRAAPKGPMEDFVFRAWIYDVWDLWESGYRTKLEQVVDDPGAIRPLQEVLGDLRLIRNNLTHSGIARRDQAAKCTILQWFREGEKMKVRFRHVLDFLNQMGWLQEGLVLPFDSGRTSFWQIDRSGGVAKPTPSLVSVRPVVDQQEQDPVFHYQVSIVFEDGVFGQFAMGQEQRETKTQARDRSTKWMKMTVDDAGDLHVPDLTTIPASELYRAALHGEKRQGPGIWHPPVKFRE